MSQLSATPIIQYLSFFMAGEEYAIGSLQVREIITCDTVTRVPSAPPWIRGVANLRGSVLPVVDLALKFGLSPSTSNRSGCIIVVEVTLQGEKLVMGVLVDAVGQVLELVPADVEPPPDVGLPVHAGYLAGMRRAGRKFILLMDIARVVSRQELLAASTEALSHG